MSKLEEKELKELRESIAKPNQIATEIGMRVIAYKSIDKLVDVFNEASKEQNDKVKEIEDKYGKGNLNIDTGEITPIEE
jgi:anti-sigma28 factor (negative regulator of flagellin synthesis)